MGTKLNEGYFQIVEVSAEGKQQLPGKTRYFVLYENCLFSYLHEDLRESEGIFHLAKSILTKSVDTEFKLHIQKAQNKPVERYVLKFNGTQELFNHFFKAAKALATTSVRTTTTTTISTSPTTSFLS